MLYSILIITFFKVGCTLSTVNSMPQLTALQECKTQLMLVWPVWLTLLCRKSIDLVPVMFVGRFGPSFLSASGLATVTANVTGYSVLIGLSGKKCLYTHIHTYVCTYLLTYLLTLYSISFSSLLFRRVKYNFESSIRG